MDQVARPSTRLILFLISACLALACSRSGDVTTHLAGDWSVGASGVQTECDPGPAVGPIDGWIRIIQTDGSLVLEQIGCCSSETIGTGTADRMFFTLTSTRTVPVAPDCSYQLDEADRGTVRGNRLSADATLQVSCSGACSGVPWCSSWVGPTPPTCQIRGRIEATRCGSGGCGPLCLGIICPA